MFARQLAKNRCSVTIMGDIDLTRCQRFSASSLTGVFDHHTETIGLIFIIIAIVSTENRTEI